MKQYQTKPLIVRAIQFPDDGPTQHDVVSTLRDVGLILTLYDGAVERNVETSTDANWRWKFATSRTMGGSIYVGDWIIQKDDGTFTKLTDEQFKREYEPTE